MQFHTTGIVLAALTVVSASSAQSTQAVEWKVSEGGNGHWYGLYRVPGDSQSPEFHFQAASSRGGHTVTISSAAENAFVFEVAQGSGALIGLRKQPNNNRAEWITGEPMAYTNWNAGEGGNWWERYALLPSSWGGLWLDTDLTPRLASVIEWETDCNSDGIVDYGQILRGELEDLNGNGVPDICETSISSVLPPSVPAQGGSAITIRGIGFPANPTVLIGGVPATNVVRESPTRITATSPAILPGMASVSVNDFTLADGIYVRPECGSDLDQNGVVDNADISIILLDFGPCYQAPLATAAPEVPPLLDAQALPDAPRQR